MKKAPLMIAAATALLSATAVAGNSSPGEIRGYQACLEANEDQFRGLASKAAEIVKANQRADEEFDDAPDEFIGEHVYLERSPSDPREKVRIVARYLVNALDDPGLG